MGPSSPQAQGSASGTAGPGGADRAPSAGWGTWAWSSSACPSSSPASSSLASSCSPASCSCTTSTGPSCSSPTWSTSRCRAPAAPAGLTGAPAPASEACGLWSWLVGGWAVGGTGAFAECLHLEPAQRRASSGRGRRLVGFGWGTQSSGKALALAIVFKCRGASGRDVFSDPVGSPRWKVSWAACSDLTVAAQITQVTQQRQGGRGLLLAPGGQEHWEEVTLSGPVLGRTQRAGPHCCSRRRRRKPPGTRGWALLAPTRPRRSQKVSQKGVQPLRGECRVPRSRVTGWVPYEPQGSLIYTGQNSPRSRGLFPSHCLPPPPLQSQPTSGAWWPSGCWTCPPASRTSSPACRCLCGACWNCTSLSWWPCTPSGWP